MHDLAVYVMEGLHFAWEISLENSADSCLYFRQALITSFSVLLRFSLLKTVFVFLHSFQCFFI